MLPALILIFGLVVCLQSVLPFRPLSQEVVVDRAIGNVIASGDTTRHMMFLSLVCLAKSPRVAAKVLLEQQQVWESSARSGIGLKAVLVKIIMQQETFPVITTNSFQLSLLTAWHW